MTNTRRSICILILMLSCCAVHAQDKWNAAGVWTGKLYNDSTKKFIPFEIAISYQNGKYSGYTYTVFVIDSIENIGVKEVTIKEKNNQWNIKDKKLIDDNYRDAPAKGVYTTIELQHSENDTADILSGRWYTNKTREFFRLTGTVAVYKRKNIFATRIVPKLRQLGLANDLSFFSYAINQKRKDAGETNDTNRPDASDSMMTIVEPEMVITMPKKQIKLPDPSALQDELPTVEKDSKGNIKAGNPKEKRSEGIDNGGKNNTASQKEVLPRTRPKANETSILNTPSNTGKSADASVPEKKKEVLLLPVKRKDTSNQMMVKSGETIEKKPGSSGNATLPHIEKTYNGRDTTNNHQVLTRVTAMQPQQLPVRKIDLSNRKIETIKTVAVSGDSLVLSLFDNGSVDGDTVSVLLNGKVVISKVRLLEKAFNQTIHLTPEMGDSIKIVLYAENLGSIPPNTGLLVVRNAGKDYEIRFSGDLTTNSAIILLRNKRE